MKHKYVYKIKCKSENEAAINTVLKLSLLLYIFDLRGLL